jgi:hypothetical protein
MGRYEVVRMVKMTPRQAAIIQKLGEVLQKEVGDISLPAAKGVVQFGLDDACRELGIELEAVQAYDAQGKLAFNARLIEKIGGRLARLQVSGARIERIKQALVVTYQRVM